MNNSLEFLSVMNNYAITLHTIHVIAIISRKTIMFSVNETKNKYYPTLSRAARGATCFTL